jgi:lysophospholipase L1-like esterase
MRNYLCWRIWLRLSLLLALSSTVAVRAAETTPKIFLAGDSTMCDYPEKSPIRGWGMALGQYFIEPAMVSNQARSGRSTKSFINEGRWATLLGDVHAGDFVIIQFGHNDEKIDLPKVGTDAATEFRDNLRRFIRDVREKHATPLLATPVSRRKFDSTGKLVPTHGAYPDAIRSVAKEENVPLLDLERDTAAWLQAEGVEPSKKFFVGLTPGAHPEKPGAAPDNTHFLQPGAEHVAGLAVDEIRALKLPLVQWLK